jgi:branched-subunit amino acid ABC-type transport system permease component
MKTESFDGQMFLAIVLGVIVVAHSAFYAIGCYIAARSNISQWVGMFLAEAVYLMLAIAFFLFQCEVAKRYQAAQAQPVLRYDE